MGQIWVQNVDSHKRHVTPLEVKGGVCGVSKVIRTTCNHFWPTACTVQRVSMVGATWHTSSGRVTEGHSGVKKKDFFQN